MITKGSVALTFARDGRTGMSFVMVVLAVKCLGKLRTVLIGSSRILAPLMETSRYFHTVSSAVS